MKLYVFITCIVQQNLRNKKLKMEKNGTAFYDDLRIFPILTAILIEFCGILLVNHFTLIEAYLGII